MSEDARYDERTVVVKQIGVRQTRCLQSRATRPWSMLTGSYPDPAVAVANRREGTSPHSIRGRVAFPTLRPPRLRLFGGPVPWTKRGKRTTCAALFGVGHADRGGSRRNRTSPHSKFGRVLPRCGGPVARSGTEHRPIQFLAELRFPPFAHRAFGYLGDRRRGRSVENARPLSLLAGVGWATGPSVKRHYGKPTPGDMKTDPLSINGTALTGLSTLCPRRRSPVNQVAVVKGWITPTETSANGRPDDAGTEHRPLSFASDGSPRVAEYC